jgi:hypothetical protein
MAKKVAVSYRSVKLKIVGPQSQFFAARVQKLDFPTTIPNTVINELGNSQHAGVTTDIPDVTATISAFDVSHKIWATLCGYDPANYPASGVNAQSLGYVDLIAYVDDTDVQQMMRCIHAKYMKVTDFTFTYTVGGESTEDYSFGGQEKRYLQNEVMVESGMVAGSSFALAHTPATLKNGNKLLSCIVSGVWLTEGTDYSVAGATVTVSGAATNRITAVYHASTDYTTWTDTSDTVDPPAIRGKNIPVVINSNVQKRVQSITIKGTLPNTKVMEMGNVSMVGYTTDVPDITGTISYMDTDNQPIALMATGSQDLTAGEWMPDDMASRKTPIWVKLLDPADNATVRKIVYLPNARITGVGTSVSVGGQLTLTYDFTSDDAVCTVFSGATAGF